MGVSYSLTNGPSDAEMSKDLILLPNKNFASYKIYGLSDELNKQYTVNLNIYDTKLYSYDEYIKESTEDIHLFGIIPLVSSTNYKVQKKNIIVNKYAVIHETELMIEMKHLIASRLKDKPVIFTTTVLGVPKNLNDINVEPRVIEFSYQYVINYAIPLFPCSLSVE